jgi:uncharacterized protein YutE (UPF0331/DUF86 family)
MLLKDMKEIVEDDYTNIENLRKIDFFTEKQEATLKEANGLRNRLIHEYNGLEQKTALYSIQEINDEMDSILEKVRIWVKKLSTQ